MSSVMLVSAMTLLKLQRATVTPPGNVVMNASADSYFDGLDIWAQCIFDRITSILDELA